MTTTSNEHFARIVAFDRVVQTRVATRIEPTAHGTAFFHEPTPTIWDRNLVAIDVPADSFEELADEAEEVQRGLPHRMLILDSDPDAEDKARAARATGWLVERHIAMVAGRPPDDDRPPKPVREVPGADLAVARRRGVAREDWAIRDPSAVDRVLEVDARLREVVHERGFASFATGEVAAVAYLYSDDAGTIGQVEDVLTVPEHRGHGHGRSVVLAALAASRAAGHEFTFLWADESDWPKELYGKLGFDVVGRRWRFRRLAGGQSSRRPPA